MASQGCTCKALWLFHRSPGHPFTQIEKAEIVKNRLITQLESVFDPEAKENVYTDQETGPEGTKRILGLAEAQGDETTVAYNNEFNIASHPILQSWLKTLQEWVKSLPDENQLLDMFPETNIKKTQAFKNIRTNVASFKLSFVDSELQGKDPDTAKITNILAVAEVLLRKATEELKWMQESDDPGSKMIGKEGKGDPIANEGKFLIASFEDMVRDQSNWVHRYGGQKRGPSFQGGSPMREGTRNWIADQLDGREYKMPNWYIHFEDPKPDRTLQLVCHVTSLKNKGRSAQREFNILLRDTLDTPVSTRLNLHVAEQFN